MNSFAHDYAVRRKNYQEALEFIGEVRASISWQRFRMKVVRHFDAFIDLLNDAQDAREFLNERNIEKDYVAENLRKILERVYFNPENDYYLILGLTQNATTEQIHNRWKSLMVLYHPDRNRHVSGDGSRCASKINEAYSVLKDSRKRMEYDRKILLKTAAQVKRHEDIKKAKSISETTRRIGQVAISPRLRRTLVNLILPVWLLLCFLIILIIFLEK